MDASLESIARFLRPRPPVHEAEYRPFPRENGRDGTHGDVEVPLLLRLLALPPGARILEIGCGGGASLPALDRLARPSRLVGVDIDAELVAEARARADAARIRCEVIAADVRALPFADGAFDVVCDFGTAYHIARRATALREIARVLRLGGRFVCETRLNQLTSHLIRAWGRTLPWRDVPALVPRRGTLMWTVRERV
ncbi:MAG: class I SAM-dependent methyltransferase [Verrucomicrobiota bacterium]